MEIETDHIKHMELIVEENNFPLDLSNKSKVSLPHGEMFRKDAFKNAFFWPKVDTRKKKQKLSKEKMSVVITSDEWKTNEKKKIIEKQKKEAQKEKKKMEAAKKKAAKEFAKATKKNCKAN